MRHETAAAKRIQKARTTLLLDHPFFGTLLFRLKGRETSSVKTMATDGVWLFYNPEFVATLSAAELPGVLAHEVFHPGLQHHVRRGNRSLKRWNMACDYAINPLVIDAGLTLPKDVLLDNRFRGMSAERIYNLIEEEDDGGGQQQDDQQGSSANNPDGSGGDEGEPNAPETPGGFGQVLDAPDAADADGKDGDEQARDWQIAVEQAETISKLAGKLPAGLERSLQGAEEARVDWRELLRRAWSETTPSDYSWMRPNRRHIWQGLYLPGVQREGVGEVVIFVDCSGSINARQLSLFESEVRSILEGQRPERVYVVYFDAQVHTEPTPESEGHEYVAATELSNLFPEYLPGLLAVRNDWNGWLMNDAGLPIEESDPLETETADMIGARLAEMQQASVPHVNALLNHGFIDQRIPALRNAMLSMAPYLEDAVLSQRSAAAPAIGIGRVKEIVEIFENVCYDLEEAGIPDTVVHNDLNSGNILIDGRSCVFTDWALAAVGNPLVALDQLQQYLTLNKRLASWGPRVTRSYCEQWRSTMAAAEIDVGLRSIRLVSIATHLASRRHWFMSRYRYKPGMDSYIRSLLRQMDKAAQLLQRKDASEVMCGTLSA